MRKIVLIGIGLCLFRVGDILAQHGHLNAGAVSWDQDSKLTFQNGSAFVASTGYLKTMVYSNTGTFASTYNGNISLTALHSTNGLGELIPGSPAPGSFVIAEIVSLKGPEGGAFSFWDETGPKLVVPTGTTNGEFRYELSDTTLGAGQPAADPFGHIHGRRFSLNKPGVYEVGFRAIDISTNGTTGGPIHTPSDVLPVTFQAGINITSIEPGSNQVHVTFGSMTNFVWWVESADSLNSANWETVGDPINGQDFFIETEDGRAPVGTRFYRVKGEAIVP